MRALTTQDGAGRMHLRVSGGGPLTMALRPVDVKGLAQFQQAADVFNLAADELSGEGPFTRGQIEILAAVSDDATSGGTHGALSLEVNVLGILGNATSVLARCAFGPLKNQALVRIYQPWDAIGFEARQVVDGLGNNSVTPKALSYSAIGRFWR